MCVYSVAVTLKQYVAVKVYVYFISVFISQGHCPCPVHTLHQRGLKANCCAAVTLRVVSLAGSGGEVLVVTDDYPSPLVSKPVFRMGEKLTVLAQYGPVTACIMIMLLL